MPNEGYQRWTVTEPYLNIHCGLGEGPYYERDHHRLRFVDIKNKQIHVIDLAKGPDSLETQQLDTPVGVTADIEGLDPKDKILIGGGYGVAILDRKTGKYEYLARYHDNKEQDDRLRSNDGSVDPEGRFWVDTMNDFHVGEPQAEGSFYRLGSDLNLTVIRTGVTIPNSISFSLDNTTMYFVHTPEDTIFAYDYDAPTGNVSNSRPFWKFSSDKGGHPDGHKMDSEGHLWQAIYGEGRVLRISPAGEVVGEVSLPTRCVTCPTFVGEDLFVTSAVEEEPEKYPESAKFGGALFKVNVGVTGVPDYKFKLKADVKRL